MKKISKKTIEEVEKIYSKASKEEIEQAEIIMNDPSLMRDYYDEDYIKS